MRLKELRRLLRTDPRNIAYVGAELWRRRATRRAGGRQPAICDVILMRCPDDLVAAMARQIRCYAIAFQRRVIVLAPSGLCSHVDRHLLPQRDGAEDTNGDAAGATANDNPGARGAPVVEVWDCGSDPAPDAIYQPGFQRRLTQRLAQNDCAMRSLYVVDDLRTLDFVFFVENARARAQA